MGIEQLCQILTIYYHFLRKTIFDIESGFQKVAVVNITEFDITITC